LADLEVISKLDGHTTPFDLPIWKSAIQQVWKPALRQKIWQILSGCRILFARGATGSQKS
jgi:hypothetical protein